MMGAVRGARAGAALAAMVLALTMFALGDASGERGRPGSISRGTPNKGELIHGRRLPEKGRGFYSNPKRPNQTAVFGTDEIIRMLVDAGADLDRWAPGATLYINDISFAEGGPIPHHASHRAGRDADLMFFSLDADGDVAEPICIPYDAEGRAVWDNDTPADPSDDEPRTFDVRRNWLVVRSMVENDEANVQRIYVAEHIRALLLDYARAHDQPTWVIERAGDMMCQPGPPHDDHFHVRIFCSAEDYRQGCRDKWPMFPWRRTELAQLGITDPRLTRPRLRRRRPRESPHPPAPMSGRCWCP